MCKLARAVRVGQEPVKNCPVCKELRKKPKSKPQADKPPEPAAPAVLCDDAGTPIPPGVEDVFKIGVMMKEYERLVRLSERGKLLVQIENSPKYHKIIMPPDEHYSKISKAVQSLRRRIVDWRPALVCPDCEGVPSSDCQGCGDKGFLNHAEAKRRKLL